MSKKRAKKKAAPQVGQFTNVMQVLAWIEHHVKPYDADSGDEQPAWTHKLLLRAALWWHANEEAQGWGDLTQKDIASILQTGLKPLTIDDLQETLDSAHDSDDESEPAAVQIEANLRAFFVAHMTPKRGALTEQQKAEVFRDFTQWSGGFTPAETCPAEICKYVRHARPAHLSAARVKEYLFERAGFDE